MSDHGEKRERSRCGQLRDYVDEVNRDRRKKGKPDKYVDLTFTRTFGDRWVVFVNHYKYGRIGPTSGIGMEGKHSAAADLLQLLQDKDKRVMGFLNFNVKAKL